MQHENDPNSNELIQRLTHSVKPKGQPTLAPMPVDSDDAAAYCLALLADPHCEFVPPGTWEALAKKNEELITAPKATIKCSLARQAVILEMAVNRYAAKAAVTEKPDHSAALMKISLSCSRTLVAVLGALNTMAEQEIDANAITV